jgi:predicted dehydrogenase
MADKVRIAVIGTGFARTVQIPAFLSHPEIQITSIASGTPGKAAIVAREFGIPFATDDWRAAIARDDVDLVCITTPPDLHHQMAIFAAECGKHILCEKPMAMNTAEAEEMSAAAKRAGVMALIDHELRFQPGRQKAFRLVRDRRIGRVLHFRYLFQAPHRGDPNLKWNWWSDAKRGGGALGAIGSHIIDSFCWIANALPNEITAQLHTHIKERPTDSGEKRTVTSDDEAILVFAFESGDYLADATGLASISMVAGPEYINRFEIFGTEGSIRIEHRGDLFSAMRGETDWQRIETELAPSIEGAPDTGFSRGFMAFVPEIVRAVKSGGNPPEFAATFEDGVRIQMVLDAARASNAERKSIRL